MKTLIDLRYCKQLRFEIVKWCAQVTFAVTWDNDYYFFARPKSLATLSAANTAAPEEIPDKTPSSLATRRAVSKASSFSTWMISS